MTTRQDTIEPAEGWIFIFDRHGAMRHVPDYPLLAKMSGLYYSDTRAPSQPIPQGHEVAFDRLVQAVRQIVWDVYLDRENVCFIDGFSTNPNRYRKLDMDKLEELRRAVEPFFSPTQPAIPQEGVMSLWPEINDLDNADSNDELAESIRRFGRDLTGIEHAHSEAGTVPTAMRVELSQRKQVFMAAYQQWKTADAALLAQAAQDLAYMTERADYWAKVYAGLDKQFQDLHAKAAAEKAELFEVLGEIYKFTEKHCRRSTGMAQVQWELGKLIAKHTEVVKSKVYTAGNGGYDD